MSQNCCGLYFLTFVFIIGSRNNIGTDWNTNIRHYELTQSVSIRCI